MSWQLTSFLILGAVLIGGFAWYERSRPPSQVVALVAALAALAIGGRIAFAAFPNVKPTTDIVIFSGYALGGAPGFAVGALTGLVSNFWFGQGPWTPWEMAGWGLCGILGAALALGRHRIGRLTLAAACGLAGVAYGALLNFSLMATSGGDLSLRHFGVLEARAVPFDAAHAIANVVFALIAGPAMVRMLIRFRERFEWTAGAVQGAGVAAVLLFVVALAVPSPARAASSTDRAVRWLESAQNSDGGFGASPGDDSASEITGWAMLGLEAAGRNPFDVASGSGSTPLDFLRRNRGELNSPGDLARTVLALQGAGADPRHFGGENLVAALLARRRDNGSYEGWPNSTAFAVIALRGADATGGIDRSLDWLRKVQNDDGGWGDVPGSPSTADGTGAVLQALSPGSKASRRGLSYLRGVQRKGGGFALGGGNGAVNTQSTAWAVQGILAAGADPGVFRRGGASALEYLAHNQRTDGSYRYAKPGGDTPSEVAHQTPVWVTGEVLVATSSAFFPISAPTREKTPKPSRTTFGGAISPSTPIPPSTVPSAPAGPGGGQGGGGGGQAPLPPGQAMPAPGGSAAKGASPETAAPPQATASEASSAEPAGDGGTDWSGIGAAVGLGVLAGAALFGAAWVGRRGWMRWRYGL
jgi:energy-coupling factor transport system substrate-specific component